MEQVKSQLSYVSAGFTAVLVGYTSSVAIIMQAADNLGASQEQLVSWLTILGLAMGATSIFFSMRYKLPILTAWSTPGAAMLVAVSGSYSMGEVVAAFAMSGLLIFLTAYVKPLMQFIKSIPSPMASALLAAIVLPFCIQAFEVAETNLTLFSILLVTYLGSKKFVPRLTMTLLLLVSLVYVIWNGGFADVPDLRVTAPVWVTPEFSFLAVINIAIPLYLVSMLSQNLPGMAVLSSFGYKAEFKPLLRGTGATTLLLAPFGSFALNLAAISAAICMSEDVDSRPEHRYKATIWGGVFYLLAGLFAVTVVEVFALLPKDVIYLLAGLALLSTFTMSIGATLKEPRYQESAVITFLIAFSGITLFGANAVILGLIAGALYHKLLRA